MHFFCAKYPIGIWFILGNELCERFNYYGMRTVLSIYLNTELGLSEDTATMVFHMFGFLSYFTAIFGAILADSFLGKFRTILYLSLVYACGSVLITVGSATGGTTIVVLTVFGLVLIGVGTGGIKPCVAAFAGCQFDLPAQQALVSSFFGIFYFTINFGSSISTFITPLLKTSSLCGTALCYPAAFGLPAVLMLTAIVIFVIGRKWYIVENALPEGNVLLKALQCSGHAVGQRISERHNPNTRAHWLDFANDKYDMKFIEDVKQALRVMYLFIPLPFFWALYDQQGSRWTFQANAMYGGFMDNAWSMHAEHMQLWNPLLILILIPVFQYVVYPLLARCNLLKHPLERVTAGLLFAAVAFVMSAIVEVQIEPTYAVLPGKGVGQVRVLNGLACAVPVHMNIPTAVEADETMLWSNIGPLEMWQLRRVAAHGSQSYMARVATSCNDENATWLEQQLTVKEETVNTYVIEEGDTGRVLREVGDVFMNMKKSDIQKPKLGIIYTASEKNTLKLTDTKRDNAVKSIDLPANDGYKSIDFQEYLHSKYTVSLGDVSLPDITIESGGVYILALAYDRFDGVPNATLHLTVIVPPNTLHMMWQFPQIFVMTVGEILLSISGLEFAFTQAPVSMKSLISAMWLMTIAVGNVIVVIVAESRISERQLYEFCLFAALMVLDMLLFVYFVMGYKYTNVASADSSTPSPTPATEPQE